MWSSSQISLITTYLLTCGGLPQSNCLKCHIALEYSNMTTFHCFSCNLVSYYSRGDITGIVLSTKCLLGVRHMVGIFNSIVTQETNCFSISQCLMECFWLVLLFPASMSSCPSLLIFWGSIYFLIPREQSITEYKALKPKAINNENKDCIYYSSRSYYNI